MRSTSRQLLTVTGALIGALVLTLALPDAVRLTTAAWTDTVSFSAPVTSGTWATTPPAAGTAKLTFVDHRTDYTSTVASIRHVVNVQNSYVDWKNPQEVRELTIVVSLPTKLFSGTPAAPVVMSATTTPWQTIGAPVKNGSVFNFTFVYGGPPLAVDASTGLVTLDFAVSCKLAKSQSISVATTATSPQASAPTTSSYVVKLADWKCP